MVKVFYGCKTNAWLGGVLFLDGIHVFTSDVEGIRFAEMFHRKYEVVEEVKPVTKKKVNK
ncbi:hypothetical protein JCM17380_24810 [Desulfosporosinus burensis]